MCCPTPSGDLESTSSGERCVFHFHLLKLLQSRVRSNRIVNRLDLNYMSISIVGSPVNFVNGLANRLGLESKELILY